jgi:signal peptide peptidase SppA
MEETAMRQFLRMTSLGISVDQEMVRASQEPRREKTVAILPVHGVLEARPSFIGQFFGMSSYESIGYTFDKLMADETVKGIILDVFSPGGMAYGASELANKIYESRGSKPIIAVSNPMAASGAYWVAAAADRIVSIPSGDTGSVGVIWEHVDFSQAHEREGVKVTVIRSSKSPHKAEMNSMEPLSEPARDYMQGRADELYTKFVADIAKFRGVCVDHVNEHFGQGRVVDSKRAMAAGMIDRVGTLQQVAISMAAGRIRIASERTEDDWNCPTAWELRMQKAESLRLAAQPVEDLTHQD